MHEARFNPNSCQCTPDAGLFTEKEQPFGGTVGFQHHDADQHARQLAGRDGKRRQSGDMVPAHWGPCLTDEGFQGGWVASDH